MYAYNPRKKSFHQLETAMVGKDRWDILNAILKEMDIKKNESPKQHWMIIGPRGIGKSHLMTLLYHKVKDNKKLSRRWVPVLFPEELKMAGTLPKFLERTLNEIIREFEQAAKEHSIIDELKQKIREVKKSPTSGRADNFFSLIAWFYRETGKHILLLPENLQHLLGKKFQVIEQKKLRAFLQTSDAVLIIGTATTVFNALHDHSHPFYHFFHVRRLKDLEFEDMKTLITDILSQREKAESKAFITEEYARLKALHSFAGGNPRLAVFLADILSTEFPGDMIEIMDRTLDELTPYFESILQGVPDYLEEVLNTLAAFEPAQSPAGIARHQEIPQTTIRKYLKKLKEDGYVKIAFAKGKSNYYCLNEYLYRIWFQMRDSSHREETRWLLELLLMVYSKETLLHEKNRLDDCKDEILSSLFYKQLLNHAVDFMDRDPDYYLMIEGCVESMKAEEKASKEAELIIEAFECFTKGQKEQAIKTCEDIIKNNPELDLGYMTLGFFLFLDKQFKKAIENYKKVTKLNPNSESAYLLWGICLSQLENYEEAIKKFMKVIELKPNSDVAYWLWGECLRKQQKLEEAIEKYKKAIELNPKSEKAYKAWGYCLREIGWYEEAIEKYKKLIELNPGQVETYEALGVLLLNQKHYEEAIEIFNKAIKLNPNSEISYLSLGGILMVQEHYEEAIKMFEKAVEFDIELDPVYVFWGTCLQNMGKYDEAIEMFKRSLEINPNSEEAIWGWGECLKMQERYNEAIAVYEKNIKDFTISHALLSYGECLKNAGHYDKALSQFEKLIHTFPGCWEGYLPYGQLLEKKNDKEGALLAYLMHIKLQCDNYSTLKADFHESYNLIITPLTNQLKAAQYIKQLYGSSKRTSSNLKASILLILLSQYDVVREKVQSIISAYIKKEGEEKRVFELFIFAIKLKIWLNLIEGNLNDILKLVELYLEYFKAMDSTKEKENEVVNFSIKLFLIQIKFNIEAEYISKIFKRIKEERDIPFSDIFFKVWTCLSAPDSVEAQVYLSEKAIAEVVSTFKKSEEKAVKFLTTKDVEHSL